MSDFKKNRPNIGEKKNQMEKQSLIQQAGLIIDPFEIEPNLKKELDEQGLVGRYINIKNLQQYGGRHKMGWRPYKRKSPVDSIFGEDVDGYVRRGTDLVLAVKTKEEVDKHKAYLAAEAQAARVSNRIQSDKQMFRQMLKAGNMDGKMELMDE